jgi:hypothetical protein
MCGKLIGVPYFVCLTILTLSLLTTTNTITTTNTNTTINNNNNNNRLSIWMVLWGHSTDMGIDGCILKMVEW